MRIAYLCADFGIPIHGTKGAAIHVRELCRALAGLGHDVRIYAPRTGGPPPPDFTIPARELPIDDDDRRLVDHLGADPDAGLTVAAAVRSMLYASGFGRRLAAELAGWQPDAIYERYALFGTAGLALARVLGVPLLLEVNAPLADEQRTFRGLAFAATARAVERDLLRGADHVLAVSGELGRWAVQQGADPAGVAVMPNAVDPDRFAVDDRLRADVRRGLGVAGRPVVGFVGSLKPWHDVAALVRAVGTLHRHGVAAHLVIVGDGPERGAIEALIQSHGLGADVTLAGAVPHAEVPAWLAAMDVAVAPYAPADDFYFSPLKLYEYLAAGRPVVAADVPPIASEIQPGRTGLLYPPGDEQALADAIAASIADPARAVSLGEAGRAWVRENRTWARNAGRVVALAGAGRAMPVDRQADRRHRPPQTRGEQT